jgi:hypothetical protein
VFCLIKVHFTPLSIFRGFGKNRPKSKTTIGDSEVYEPANQQNLPEKPIFVLKI